MNVLVVVLDTVRPDTLGVNGNPVCRTPAIDRLAAEGAIFDNAYAEFPVTVPTRCALVAGIYIHTNRPWSPLRSYDLHVAEHFGEAGYRTVAFSDSPFQAVVNLDRGFGEFNEFPTKLRPPAEPVADADDRGAYFPPNGDADRRHWRSFVEGFLNAYPREFGAIGMPLLVDRACEWLDQHGRSGPFFMWLDTFQPHEPWCPPDPYHDMYQPASYSGRYLPMPTGPDVDWMTPDELEHVKALYMGEVTYTDHHVGRLLAHLDDLGIGDDTLVVLLSDHGQPFGDHGTIRKFGVPLYEELARIVLVVRKPGDIPAGVRIEGLVETCDLLPSLVELAGLPEVQPVRMWGGGDVTTGMDGVSFAPLLRGEADAVRDAAYIGAFNIRTGIRMGPHKFIDNCGEKPNELYDLEADPGERANLLQKEPDLAADLHRRIWEFHGRWAGVLAWRDAPAGGKGGK